MPLQRQYKKKVGTLPIFPAEAPHPATVRDSLRAADPEALRRLQALLLRRLRTRVPIPMRSAMHPPDSSPANLA